MNKIFKILSILVIGFVMFSCANPSSNPEEQTYSITFVAENPTLDQPIADLLNSLPDYKNLEEGTKVELPTVIYGEESDEEYTIDLTESSAHKGKIYYEGNITSMLIGNENVEIKFWADDFESL